MDVGDTVRTHSAIAPFLLVAAVAAAISLIVAPNVRGIFGAGLALVLFAIAYYDAHYLIIPNSGVGAALVLALVQIFVAPTAPFAPTVELALLRVAVVAGALLAVKLGYQAVRGRHGLGMGDVKLAAVAGAWLDWLTILVAIDIAVFAALASYVVRQYARQRPLRATGALPFGLYLAPAIWLGWLLEATLLAP